MTLHQGSLHIFVHSSSQLTSDVTLQALFQPQDDSFPSAASDILATRDAASQEQQAAAEKALAVQQGGHMSLQCSLLASNPASPQR